MKRLLLVSSCMIVGALALLALAAGCGGAKTQGDDSEALEGKTWRATAILGLASVQTAKGTAATAEFWAGQVGGSGSVNSWGASYITGPGNTIQISDLMTTEMAGPQDLMAQEAAYYAALPKAATYRVSETSLTLLDSEGAVLVTYEAVPPAPLTGTEWQTMGYHAGASGDQAVSSDDPVITATFGADGTLAGNAGVNQYFTKYTAAAEGTMTVAAAVDGTMTIDPQIATTKMAGPDSFMAQERAYLAALPKTAAYTIDGGQLTLWDASGAVVVQFTAK